MTITIWPPQTAPENQDILTTDVAKALMETQIDDFVDLKTYATSLEANAGAGLSLNVNPGVAWIEGLRIENDEATGLTVIDNATNYIYYLKTGGFVVTTSVLPIAHSVSIATVVTSGGSISTVTDTRPTLESLLGSQEQTDLLTEIATNTDWLDWVARQVNAGTCRVRSSYLAAVAVGAYFGFMITNPAASGKTIVVHKICGLLQSGGVCQMEVAIDGYAFGADAGTFSDIVNPKAGGAVTTVCTFTKSNAGDGGFPVAKFAGPGVSFDMATNYPLIIPENHTITAIVFNRSAGASEVSLTMGWAEVTSLP